MRSYASHAALAHSLPASSSSNPPFAGASDLDDLFDLTSPISAWDIGVSPEPGQERLSSEPDDVDAELMDDLAVASFWQQMLVDKHRSVLALVLGGMFFVALAWGLYGLAFPNTRSTAMGTLMAGGSSSLGQSSLFGSSTGGLNFAAVESEVEVIDPNGSSKNLPIGTSMSVLASARSNGSVPAVRFGRSDPFMPLVSTQAEPTLDENATVMIPLEYVGIIKDTSRAKNPRHVAMLQTESGGSKQTLIKEVGDDFVVDGQMVTVRSITENSVDLMVGDELQTIMLKSYADVFSGGKDTSGAGADDNLSTMERIRRGR